MLKAILLQCIQNRNPLLFAKAKQLAMTWAGSDRDLPLAQLRPSLLPGEKVDMAAPVSGHNPVPGPGTGEDIGIAGEYRQTPASIEVPDS